MISFDDRLSASPAITAVTSVAATGTKAVTGKLFDDKGVKSDVRDSLTAVGILLGMPIGAGARQINYLIDDKKSSGPVDAVRGFVTGKSSKKC